MPKSRLSNDKGLVQSSGNGLQLTPANANGAGMHFKSVRVEFLNLTGSNTDNAIITDLGASLPAQSIVLGVNSVVDALTSTATNQAISLGLGAASQVVGHTFSGTDLLALVNTGKAGSDVILNLASGSFLDTGTSIGTNTQLYLVEDGAAGQTETFASGSINFNIVYAGVES